MADRALHQNPPQADADADAGTPFEQRPDQLERIWSQVRHQLASSLPESTFQLWLDPIRPIASRGNVLHLDAPGSVRAWVERRYAELISQAVGELSTFITEISFDPLDVSARTDDGIRGGPDPNPTHTFDRFVIGSGNHLAHSACLAVAEAPSEAYNPLFLHGPPGLGKTHLLGAIANYLHVNAPQLRVLYTNAESFTSEFVNALKRSGADAFKRRYRDLDVLLVDDIQFLAGKNRTEEEFFHTFNALHEAGSQIVLSADRIPADISTLPDRLRDRFEWGLTVPLDNPDLSTRLVVLRRLALEAGLELADPEALTVLARRAETNVRQLHGALTRTIAHASLRAVPLTTELISDVLPTTGPESGPPGPEEIRAIVADRFQIEPEALASGRRDARTVRARHLAIYFTRELTDLSLSQIATLYGRRDHTTVLNAVRRISEAIDEDPDLAADVDGLRTAIHTPPAARR